MEEKKDGEKDNPDKNPEPIKKQDPTKKSEAQKRQEEQRRAEIENEDRNSILQNHGYTPGRSIGYGSYATVKLSDSREHNGIVAIKVISKFHAPPDYLRKFLPREILVVKGLSHPNLIKFHQAIETTHRVYIIMEYAEKGSLLDVIRKDSYIDEKRARVWFNQLIDAVEYCHSRGVVHRDIKCENLLMNANYQIKLSDFGFARGNMGTKENEYVLSDTFCGSYAYASPEILKGIPYRPQYSDIWSSGVVLYATVYGRLPFDDSNFNNLLKQVQKPVNFPKEPRVSSECKVVIRKILAPLRERLKISGIREQPWTHMEDTPEEAAAVVETPPPTGIEADDGPKKATKAVGTRL